MNRLKRNTTLLFLLLLIPLFGISQNKLFFGDNKFVMDSLPKPISVIYSNPIAPLMSQIPFTGEYRMVYETPVAHDKSVTMGVSYLGKSLLIYMFDKLDSIPGDTFANDVVVRGIRGQLSYRFFLFEEALTRRQGYPQGLYIGPHVSFASAIISMHSYNWANIFTRASYFNLSVISGLKYSIFDKLVIDIFSGIGYRYNIIYNNLTIHKYMWKDEDKFFYWDTHPIFKHYKISFGFNIGYVLGRKKTQPKHRRNVYIPVQE